MRPNTTFDDATVVASHFHSFYRDAFAEFCTPLSPSPSYKELEKEEADLCRSKDDILHQSQRLTASFLEQKGELEGSAKRAEERVCTAKGEVAALKEDLDAARYRLVSSRAVPCGA